MNFEDLLKNGEFQTVIEYTEKDLQNFTNRYWQITTYWRMGQYDKALELGMKYLEDEFEYEQSERTQLIYRIGAIHYSLGQFEVAIQHFNHVLKLMEDNSESKLYADTLNVLGVIYFTQGSKKAVPFFERAIEKFTHLKQYSRVGSTLINLASYYYDQGKLALALQYYTKGYNLFIELDNIADTSAALWGIGLVNKDMGNFDEAMKYYKKGLQIATETGRMEHKASIMGLIANIYQSKGEFSEALKHHQAALQILKETDNRVNQIICLSRLVDVSLLLKDTQKAENYYQEMGLIEINSDDPRVPFYRDFARGLLLKNSNRMIDIGKAQEIFRHLIFLGSDTTGFEARKIYVELLLAEYRTFKEEEILREIDTHIFEMENLAYQRKKYPSVVEVKILRAKLASIGQDFDLAHKIVQEARDFSIEKDLVSYLAMTEKELIRIEHQLEQLKKVIEASTVLQELEEAQLLEYIQKMQQVR